jgi:DNA mismatch repair protein MutS2
LEAQRRQQETKAAEASKILQQAEQLYGEVSRKSDLLKEREADLKQQQEQAIQQAIAQAKGEIAAVIRRLQRGKTTAQDAQKATEQVDKIAEKKLPSRQQPAKPKPGYRPQVGERVRIPRLGQTAEVLTEPDADGEITVRFGLMKMTVGLGEVESLQGEKAEVPTKPKPEPAAKPAAAALTQSPAVRTERNTIDLRGQRVSEAEPVLEEAIANAVGPLWVIHGHGTGKLRRGVHEFLKRHPQVERFEYADQSEGGKGATVVHVTLPSYD